MLKIVFKDGSTIEHDKCLAYGEVLSVVTIESGSEKQFIYKLSDIETYGKE